MEFKDLLKQHTDAVEQQLGALDKDVKQALEDAGFFKSVVGDLEQKMARLPENLGGDAPRSPGQQFVEADEVKGFIGNASSGRKLSVEVKAITTATGSGGALFAPQRDMAVQLPQRPLESATCCLWFRCPAARSNIRARRPARTTRRRWRKGR
jgi:hypothetical protein